MVKVCSIAQLPLGTARLTEFEGKPVCVFHTESGVYATEEMCPHRAGPLSEGKIEGNLVTCPWHRAQFDITTGKRVYGPAARDLKTYAIEIIDGDIFLKS